MPHVPATRFAILSLTAVILIQAVGIDTVAAAVVEECYSPELEKQTGSGRYNCMTTEVVRQQIRPTYDLGYQGATNLSEVAPPYAEWPSEFAPGFTVPGGVHVGATYERLAILFAGDNQSANLSLAARPQYVDFNGLQTLTTGAIHALQYQVRINSSDVMNGASEFYFRSPLKWDAANYTAHYLNIVELHANGSIRKLVAGARYMDEQPTTDTSDALLHGDRLYYHFSGLFHSDRLYTVNEYVVPRVVGGAALALPELPVYVAEGQDIAGDGHFTTRLFPGHGAVERTFGANPSVGMQFMERAPASSSAWAQAAPWASSTETPRCPRRPSARASWPPRPTSTRTGSPWPTSSTWSSPCG